MCPHRTSAWKERFNSQRTTNILILDNASWHKLKTNQWHGWQPKYLPPYLNPIERIWLTMKARWFNNYISKSEEKLLERLDQAILDTPTTILTQGVNTV